jgi:hypothetical protein
VTSLADVLDSLVAATALGGLVLATVLGLARSTVGRRRRPRRGRGGVIGGTASHPTLRSLP